MGNHYKHYSLPLYPVPQESRMVESDKSAALEIRPSTIIIASHQIRYFRHRLQGPLAIE
jgi:hypothetical protein